MGYHIEGTGDLAKAVHVQMRALVDAELDRQKNRQKIEQLAMKIRAQLDQLSSPVVEALDGLGVAGAPTAKKHDPQTVLPLLTAERIRRATQLNKAIATDLAARESTIETAGLEELFQAFESPVPVRRGSARGP